MRRILAIFMSVTLGIGCMAGCSNGTEPGETEAPGRIPVTDRVPVTQPQPADPTEPDPAPTTPAPTVPDPDTTTLQFKLPRLVGDNMVLQRNETVRIWGSFNKDGKVTVTLNGQSFEGDCKNGAFEVLVQTGDAGGPYTLTLESAGVTKVLQNVLIGDVYICAGQSNIIMQVGGLQDKTLLNTPVPDEIRMFHVWTNPSETPLEDCQSTYDIWVQSSTMGIGHYENFSAAGYIFARTLYEATGVPIGIIQAAEGATITAAWLPEEDAQKVNPIGQDLSDPLQRAIPSRMYNGMVHPLRNYTVRGVMWYQGESNLGDHTFDETMKVLIESWRRVFRNEDMTFTIVQLPRWGSNDWFELRELQKKAATTIPNCTYSVNIDCGEFVDIHPQDKEPIGVRAAQATLRDFYGMTEYKKNPVYASHTVSGNTVRITFDNVDQGLFFQIEQTRGGKDWKTVTEGTGFEIMDQNGRFYPATATLEGNTLVLTGNVQNPKGFRYAAGNFPGVSLFDKNGMPAEQFSIKFS